MKKFLVFLLCLFIFISCQKDEDISQEVLSEENCDNCKIEITIDDSRLKFYNQITTKSTLKSKKVADTIELVLKAILDPLTVELNGKQVQLNANHVTTSSRRTIVSYSVIGEPYGGAVDIINTPNNADPQLVSTLIIPDKDIDAVVLMNRTRLIFGGGIDVDKFSEASSSSFFESYTINGSATDPSNLNLVKRDHQSTGLGNKISGLNRYSNKFAFGSGGGSSGTVFTYIKNTNEIHLNATNELDGYYIFDTACEDNSDIGVKKLVVMAYNKESEELKAFYYLIDEITRKLSYEFNVSLGFWNLNVEAKHSILVPQVGTLMVSLEQEGVGLFSIQEVNGEQVASLSEQIKDTYLNPNNPDETINSLSKNGNQIWAAGGAAGIISLRYNKSSNTINANRSFRVEVPGESVNSVTSDLDELIVASTSGVRIYQLN